MLYGKRGVMTRLFMGLGGIKRGLSMNVESENG